MKKNPPKDRERPKPKKKQLVDACRDMKSDLFNEKRQRLEDERRRRDEAEADAVMEQIYGPNWRTA